MSIPKQVQAQAEEADRLEAELLATNQPAEGVTPPVEAPPAEAAQPVPEPEVPPAPEPEAATPTPPTTSEETWERRFKSLQGKYNAEVPRLHADLKDLRAQLDALKQAQQAPAPKTPEPLVTEKDVETFGSDLLDVIDRKAREVARSMVDAETAELKAENQRLNEQLSGVAERQVTNDQRGYFVELSRQVPDWETVNVDPGFMDWLAEVDALSGAPRQAYLDSAFNAHDVARTAALFNAYKATLAPAPQQTPARRELERQVAPTPSKGNASNPPASASEKVYSLREIETFYHDVAQGKYSPDEAKRVENEIDLAVATGRVR